MSSRSERLADARHIDWRFLLPSPALGRVAWLGPIDASERAALVEPADEVGVGSRDELRSRAPWDVVVTRSAGRGSLGIEGDLDLLHPGGWLVLGLPRRARARRLLGVLTAALHRAGAETVRAYWFAPNRRRPNVIVALDDREAIMTALARRPSRPASRVRAIVARAMVRAGVPPDLVGGDVVILARRAGGDPVTRWPSLDPVAERFQHLLAPDASWTLLTPRFAASAHVVLILRSAGVARLVAKIARLGDDDGPEREGRFLESLAATDVARGTIPTPTAIGRTAGHATLIEEALNGEPLDRRMLRGDPARWISAAGAWLAGLPRDDPRPGAVGSLVREALDTVATVLSDSRSADLVASSRSIVAELDGRSMASVMEHGDFSHPNLLVRPDGALAVLDWELARVDGLPLHDLSTFLDYVALATSDDERDPFDAFDAVLAHDAWGAAAALRAEADRLGVDRDLLPVLVICSWIRTLAGLTGRLFDGETGPPAGWQLRNRYYLLWERSVQRLDRLQSLLA